MAQLYPRALSSLSVTSYDSQGYDGGIPALPQPGGSGPRIYVPQQQDGPVPSPSQKSKSCHDQRPVTPSNTGYSL
jgi:hypothetical protein